MGIAASEVKSLESRMSGLKSQMRILEEELVRWRQKAEFEANIGLKPIEPHRGAYRIYQLGDGIFDADYVDHDEIIKTNVPLFQTENQAKAFGEAFQVLLEMRAQPGVTVPEGATRTCCVIPQRDGTVKFVTGPCIDAIPSTIYARFESETAARNAVTKVGAARIIRAAKTLAFFP